jgi:hypothetical protein
MAREYIPVALARQVRERAGHRCEYCRCPTDHATEAFCIEHIRPFSLGGPTSEGNLALSCSGCNLSKATRTEGFDEVTQSIAPLFNPRQDRWPDHFAWSSDDSSVVPLTPTGRVTVDALKLNRAGVRNLRRLLSSASLHPPSEEPTA